MGKFFRADPFCLHVLAGAMVLLLMTAVPAHAQGAAEPASSPTRATATTPVPAQPASASLETPACRGALQELQAMEARRVPPETLQALRERASQACLGGPAGRPGPAAQTPVVVPPVSRPAPAPAPVRSGVPAPPPVVPPTSGIPLTVVACDSTGCTASDGSRLTRAGSTLVGPRGACTLEGAVLRCP